MQKEKQNKPGEEKKEGYVVVPNYFLREQVKILGIGPALLYLQLLSYCHKEKDIAWPTLTTLSNKLGISKNSLLSYRKILLEYGLIKKIVKRRTVQGNYQSNFYKITPIEGSAKIELRQVQILGGGSANIAPGVVQNLHPNNTNLNITNITTKREKDAAVAAVNFKKLKKEGEEKMQTPYNSKEHYTGQAIRERMAELDFKEEFVEKMLKEYSLKKIHEKLDLLMERKNIQNPAGWLRSALKNDYQGEEPAEQPSCPRSHPHLNPPPSKGEETRGIDSRFHGNDIKGSEDDKCRGTMHRALNESGIDPSSTENTNTPEQTSREAALKEIKLIQDNLSACISPVPSRKRAEVKKNVGVRFIEPAKLRGG